MIFSTRSALATSTLAFLAACRIGQLTPSQDHADAASADGAIDAWAVPDGSADAGSRDGGAIDAAVTDATVIDAAVVDASLPDASLPDASLPDASLPDAGTGAKSSDGCGKALSTKLKNNPPGNGGSAATVNKITVGGRDREFLVRWPSDYNKDMPYRLILGLHGHGGSWQESGLTNYGLWNLSKGSTIFVTLSAIDGNWDGPTDLAYTDEVLKLVEGELCIATSRVMLEGFSQGGWMASYLACSRPGVFRAVAGHSGGAEDGGQGTCSNFAYLGSVGLNDLPGLSQATLTDPVARTNGCTVENLPTAQPGKHVCTPYKGCKTGFPVTFCSFDGGHDYQPKDSGASSTWMPQAVWEFLSPL
jgi:poly(3-hydroxybutyrate) depolymerase